MDDNIQNFNFLKDTVSKFKGEIQKMISDSNYSNTGVIQLKQTIDEIEKNISSQEKYLVSNYLNTKKSLTNAHKMNYVPAFLPQINRPKSKIINYTPEDEVYTTIRYAKQSTLDRLKQNRNKREINEEKLNYIKHMKKRKPKGSMAIQSEYRAMKFNQNKYTNQLLSKYNINSNLYDNMKVTNHMPNFMDREKRFQYSVLNKKFSGNEVLYDKYRQPIIRKEELDKGLLNMVYKGLIPKGADLSPAFEAGGNPLQLNPNFKEDFAKSSNKDDYDYSEGMSRIKVDDNFFITKAPDIGVKNQSNILYNQLSGEVSDKEEEKGKDNIEKSLHTNPEDLGKENEEIDESEIEVQKKKVLIFSSYVVVKNEEYKQFYNENQDKWGAILYLFEHLSKLFKRLSLTLVEVSQERILALARDELRVVQNKDLLMCISDQDLVAKGLDPNNPIQFYSTIKEKFVVMIQMAFRYYKARKKVNEMKSYFKKIRLIQNTFLSSKLITSSREKAKNLFEKRYNSWTEMMKNFKTRWELIKSMPRVEIHFNTITQNSPNGLYLNTTYHKFSERENNQLNRIINLYDPSIEIIYVSPFKLNSDILSYYYSIMATLGIENVVERFHVIVPEEAEKYPPHFSISQLLLLSPNTVREIKKIVGEREAYIVPGNGGKVEVELSMLMDIPILMGDLFQSETIFTKSGSKLIFEANEVNIPISAWDIKSEFEFFASLAHLVVTYPEYDCWVFKMDNEINGRGIASIQLDKIAPFVELRKNYHKYEDKKKYEVLVGEVLQKNIAKKVKIAGSLLYKSWEEFFQDFIAYRGVIEACPAHTPNLISGSPCLPIFIEPDGNISHLPTFDKVNLFNFRNFGAISPQRSITTKDNVNLKSIAEKIGKYLYEHEVIGYVTIELITVRNGTACHYWAIDLKFGLTDIISSINFCHFLYNHATDRLQPDINTLNLSLNNDKSISAITSTKCEVFTFPFLAHQRISEIKINDLVKSFRSDNLIFDVEKKRGVIFNFSDTLQCGNMGVCGMVNLEDVDLNNHIEMWKMIKTSFHIISMAIKLNEFQPTIVAENRTDILDIGEIINRIYKLTNNVLVKKKEKEVKNSGNNSFLNKI